MALRKKKTLLVQAGAAAVAARPHVDSALSSAGDFVSKTAIPALNDARDKAGPALADARVKAREVSAPYVAQARDLSAPYVADAKDKAAPHLATVRDRTAPYVNDATAKVAPVVAAGAAAAGSRAEAVKNLADAKVAEVTGQQQKKRSKLKTLLVVAGLAGAAALVAKKLQDSHEDPWQSSYTPTPPPAPPTPASPAATTTAGPIDTDDSAGASPEEALADAAGEPHSATTPDDPAEVIDIDGQHKA